MSRLTRDGTVEPVSRDQILRRERAEGNEIIFPVQLTTSRIGNLTRLILTLAIDYVMTIHTYSGVHVCIVVVVVVVDSHIQRIVLATEETTVTQQVSHRPIKRQSRLWSQRGTKVNGSHHGDNPPLYELVKSQLHS